MQIRQWLYVILFIVVFSACSDNNTKKYVIGVSQCSEDIWRDKLNNELVMSTYQHDNVMLKFASANDNDKLQKQQIDQFIKEKVNLLIVSPNQIHTISSVIDKAYDAGIPVIFLTVRQIPRSTQLLLEPITMRLGTRWDSSLHASSMAREML